MYYLDGSQVLRKTAADWKNLIGNEIVYLRDMDIDKSGRGYYFPKYGIPVSTHGRQVEMDNGDYIPFNSFQEVVLRINEGKDQ